MQMYCVTYDPNPVHKINQKSSNIYKGSGVFAAKHFVYYVLFHSKRFEEE